MIFYKRKLFIILATLLITGLFLAALLDKALFFGFLLVIFLSSIVFFIFYKFKIANKALCSLFLITFFLHLAMALFIYYANFQPFGAGDFVIYQEIAEQVSQRINAGNFSLEGINYLHGYPVLIGAIYSITAPEMIVGQLFSVWLSAISVLLAYLIALEIGCSKKSAFLTGLIVCIYPSFLYFGSLMLKDIVVVSLVLLGILLSIKIFKNFTVLKFLAFFAVLTFTIHLRFYIGFALMFSFIICWFLASNLKIRKRTIYGLAFILILGFSPQLLGYGYYGTIPLYGYLNKKTIITYREVVYAPLPAKNNNITNTNVENSGVGSSFVVKTGLDESSFVFIKNYFKSFIYAFLGPFFWQIKYQRHLFFLFETIPWYFLISFIVYGLYKLFKKSGIAQLFYHYRFAVIILVFGAMALGALSLFINNFGIIVRIRMPVFITIFCLIGLNKNIDNILEKITYYFYEKKFNKFFGLPDLQERT